jgi:hypothetical protein
LQTFDPASPGEPWPVSPAARLGSIVAMGPGHVLALYDHPRLIDLKSGTEVLAWPHLKSGTRAGCLLVCEPRLPVMAVDTDRQRFAIADADGITVVQLNLS